MNRRSFLARLIAVPAGAIAAVKAIRAPKAHPIIRPTDYDGEPRMKIWVPLKSGEGCTLTRMHTTPLTPEQIANML